MERVVLKLCTYLMEMFLLVFAFLLKTVITLYFNLLLIYKTFDEVYIRLFCNVPTSHPDFESVCVQITCFVCANTSCARIVNSKIEVLPVQHTNLNSLAI